MKKIIAIIFPLILIMILTACGSKTVDSGVNLSTPQQKKESTNEKSMDSIEKEDSKIIVNTFLQLETTEFEKTVSEVQNLTNQLSGYIATSNISNTSIQTRNQNTRYASYQLKIPKDNVSKFIGEIKKYSNIVNTTTESIDVTTQYQDTESRIKVLKTREERLLELLKNAQNLSDTIKLEEALSDVIYEREKLQANLNKLNKDITYTAVNLDISEVDKYNSKINVKDSFFDKVVSTFVTSINYTLVLGERLILGVIGFIPLLVLFIPIILVTYFIIKKYKNRK
ncbi:DUF4349 domain-containing protein [Romboutsia sp.]|uniref:DUF4349 domain-containing protein n=1 Tax=Romboutsia sp. TaxID=1965302 RepID=UPI003F2C1D1E